MRVALVGPPQSGKSTLFAAVAEAGGSHVNLSRPDQPHLAVVKVPDERLVWLAKLHQPDKVVPAELEFLDIPGFDMSDEAGQSRAKAHWAAMRQCDMLAFVVRGFADETTPAYRGRIDAEADVEELLVEMLFADLDQVTGRIAKLETSIKKPTPHRGELIRELDLMKQLAEALESERPISSVASTHAEEKILRGFGFLSRKPSLVVLNCDESAAAEGGPDEVASVACIQLSARIEEEIARLDPEERSEFLADLGLKEFARDRLIRSCYGALNLVSFLTIGKDEVRAWAIPAGTEAVTAAGEIHTDIARGFIRAETVAYNDLADAGDIKAAKAAGKVRLEGKHYIVQDGDVIDFRFNV